MDHPRSPGRARSIRAACEAIESSLFLRAQLASPAATSLAGVQNPVVAAQFDTAETIPGPTTESFTRLAVELNVVLVASVFERRMAGVFHNTAVVIDAGGALLGLYRKMHIPDDPRFYEKYYFTPGDLG